MKTKTVSKKDIKVDWHLMDAKGQILGRFATEVAQLLIGKQKPYYSPNLNCGDKVVVVNAKNVAFTGQKDEKKIYYRHSNYPGGLKEETLGDLLERRPTKVIEKAVYNMLPKNKLRKERMANLYIYAGAEHPHQGQVK